MAEPISEAEVYQAEEKRVRYFIAGLRSAVEVETSSETVDLGRWGQWSADWNKRRMAWMDGLKRCRIRARRHRLAHRAALSLFPAWQSIHYTLTRGKAPDLSKLDAVERMLEG